MGSSQSDRSSQERPVTLGRGWRCLLSVVLIVHVTAVFIAPFTFASSPAPGVASPSPLAASVLSVLEPYVDALFLQHGYAFFAPDPGPSHLFRVHLEFADGREPVELTFPDRDEQRPRLWYHRHFMLSERLWDGYVPPVAPPAIAENPRQLVMWRESRERYETYFHTLRDSYLNRLRKQHGAERATLVRVEHRLPGIDEVIGEGRRIDDPELYLDHIEDLRAEELP